jgi:hypothetical protein
MNILYFIKGLPTDKQKALAKKAGAKIRNVSSYHTDDPIEKCDSVMGDIPDAYKEKYKISEHQNSVKRLTNKPRKSEAIHDETDTGV